MQVMPAVPSLDGVYAEHVNPQWVRLLNLLQMNVRYQRCSGSELFTADGRRILDFLSGYCVHNAGHNHPAIVGALKEELDRQGPAMLQSHVPLLAAELAERLSARAGLLSGIEFTAPRQLRLRVAFETFRHIHPRMFGQVLVMRLFRDRNILTQICGNNFMVLKVAPPLVATAGQIEEFVAATREVVDLAHNSTGFWAEALGLARRAVDI